jgi:hypothetical protein
MPIVRAQCSWQFDDSFATNAVVINPHFSKSTPFTDWQSLADDLADALDDWCVPPAPLTVKLYDAQGAPPQPPQATAVRGGPGIPAAGFNKELALCLSYRRDPGYPRQRGRLFIPMVCAKSAAPTGARPGSPDQTKVAALVPIFADLGGIDVDWCVYSRLDDQAYSVLHWWVDDAWDVVRSRGPKASSRIEGDINE